MLGLQFEENTQDKFKSFDSYNRNVIKLPRPIWHSGTMITYNHPNISRIVIVSNYATDDRIEPIRLLATDVFGRDEF